MNTDQINQDQLLMLGIPPSRANPLITLPLTSSTAFTDDMKRLSLTAEDLKPIDWRKKVELNFVKNQGTCGDCWAQSSTSALTDRFIIQKRMSTNLNPTIPTQCIFINGSQNVGCGGGSPMYAGQFFEQYGTTDTNGSCPVWLSSIKNGPGGLPTCNEIENMCSKETVYKAVKGSTRTLGVSKADGTVDESQTITNMKKELLNGPYPVCFLVPKDFMAPQGGYKWTATNGIFINGAYNDVLSNVLPTAVKNSLGNPSGKQWQDIIMEGPSPAAHAVELVGWDVGNAGPKYGKIPYWIVKNSWGPTWNEDGYFRMAMNLPPKKYNAYLGLDIPVNSVTIASIGKSTGIGGYMGCGTAFDPDLSTGGPGGNTPPAPSPNGTNGTSAGMSMKIVLGVLLGVVGLTILYFLISYIMKRSKKKAVAGINSNVVGSPKSTFTQPLPQSLPLPPNLNRPNPLAPLESPIYKD